MAENPFRGAYAFRREDAHLFFGRDREAWELEDLAVARRAVLLYSPSGAGKSSLLEARLKPALARLPGGVVVPPTVRLGRLPQPGTSPSNPLVASVLASLGVAGAGEVPLAKGLQELVPKGPDGRRPPCFLVFDQFEELFTATFGHPELCEDFLGQLAEAFGAHPWLSAVFALREDYLPQLDALRHLLPDGLRARLRLGFLEREAAREAICGPLRTLDSPIDLPIDSLLDELARSIVVTPGGGQQELRGGPIEPVYLQIVCWRLTADVLESRRAYPQALAGEAMRDLLAEAGGIARTVETALTDYYRRTVEQAARASGVPEHRLRRFCTEALITGHRTRNLEQRGDTETGGLPNAAVEALVDAYLVRREDRRGLFWYELAHDRLIEPVLGARSEVEARAWLWGQKKERALLWRSQKLRERRYLPVWGSTRAALRAAWAALRRQGGEKSRAERLQAVLWPERPDPEREFLWASWRRLALFWAICAGGLALVLFLLTLAKPVWVSFLEHPLYQMEREIFPLGSEPPLDRSLLLAVLHFDFARSAPYRALNPKQPLELARSRRLLRVLLAQSPGGAPPPGAPDPVLRRRACEAAGRDLTARELLEGHPYWGLHFHPCRAATRIPLPWWVRGLRVFDTSVDRLFRPIGGSHGPR